MAPVPWLRRPSANVGKSTVGLALTKLFTQPTIGNDQIDADDYPYNNIGPMTIEGVLGFLPSEVNRVLPQTASEAQKLRQWLLEGKEVTLTLIRPQQSDQDKAVLRWTKGLSATPSELTDTPTTTHLQRSLSGPYPFRLVFSRQIRHTVYPYSSTAYKFGRLGAPRCAGQRSLQ